jgi:hypothetical protein
VDIKPVEQRYTERWWTCGSLECETRHADSVTASRCPHRLKELRALGVLAQQTEVPLLDRLVGAQVGGCSCLTKTPDWRMHKPECHYRLFAEAHIAISEQEYSFDLRWKADMRAIARWREEEPEARALRQPDHADLCLWLMEQLQEADQDKYDERMDTYFEGYKEN